MMKKLIPEYYGKEIEKQTQGIVTMAFAKGSYKAGDSQGQTRQHKRIINLLGMKQIDIGGNKMDCDTAGTLIPEYFGKEHEKQTRGI
eukprot:612175-Heterocapsa_arctica.AAC.1